METSVLAMDRPESSRLTVFMLIAATIVTGLFAGLLYGFACAVMPGLRRVDDAAFVAVMQSINRRIRSGAFLLCFIGAPLLVIVAGVVAFIGNGTGRWPIAAAAAFTAVSYLITVAVNVPLNNALDAAGRTADPGRVRGRFERHWIRWNTARALASAASFGCLCWALALS